MENEELKEKRGKKGGKKGRNLHPSGIPQHNLN
jgi:hypothetical protein